MKLQIEAEREEAPVISYRNLALTVALAIGASYSEGIAVCWGLVALLLGLYDVFKTKDQNCVAAQWCAYIAGLEVVLRGTGGSVIWEFGKYSILLLLAAGIYVGATARYKFPKWILVALILLIPGVLTTFTWSNRISEDISFNISGILCLLISVWYFSTRELSLETLKNVLAYFILPVIALVVVITVKSPSLSEINFKSSANFAASGGFGPNQVATILGAGWLLILVMVLLKGRLTPNKYITYFFLSLIIFRSLLTFSRGGNVAAVLALGAFLYIYVHYKDYSVVSKTTFRNLIIFAVAVFLLGMIVNEITGGMFENRIKGLDGLGQEKVDKLSGRAVLIEEEISLFIKDPLGVGVGGSTYFRNLLFSNPLASHNEFGRLLSEHGILGIGVIILLIVMPIRHICRLGSVDGKAFCAMFFTLAMLTAMHSAFRLAMPAFFYGLSFLTINEESPEEST